VNQAVGVREAGLEDVEKLALVGAATFLETFAGVLGGSAIVAHCKSKHSAEYYSDALASGCRGFVAELDPDNAPVGFVLVGPPDLPATGEGDLELKRIYVLSRFHGSGLGAALMQQAIAAADGFRRLVLGVYDGNDRAKRFYQRNGFEPIATRRFDVGGTLYDDTIFARIMTA
jgi:ribosomal protein S18 acetylase RimI-like enzyme